MTQHAPLRFAPCALAVFAVAWAGATRAQDLTNHRLMASSVIATSTDIGRVASTRTLSVDARPLSAWPVVSNSQLDAVRGGFDIGRGLLASFGLQRLVYINGNLVSSTSVDIPNIGQMTSDQASALAAAIGTVNVIQNGAGNRFDPSTLNHTIAATVIQNSLNNQELQSLTTINATVDSLNIFRNLNLQGSLQAGLVGSLGH